MPDIRIEIGLFEHRKTRRLIKELGYEAFFCLLRLWSYARIHRPKGILYDMDAEDIEAAAMWRGQPGVLIKHFVGLKWLDLHEGSYSIHDWGKHQPWAVGAEDRSRIARENVMKRWEKVKPNGLCEFPGCSNKAAVEILGRKSCSIPAHRGNLFSGVFK